MLRSLLIGSGATDRATDIGLLILRVGVGLAMALGHGLGKVPPSAGFVEGVAAMGFPAPVLFAWLAALSEFLGGLMIALGLLTRPAAASLAFTMGIAFFVRHGGDSFADKEPAFVFGVVALALVATGAGRMSVDGFLRRRWLA